MLTAILLGTLPSSAADLPVKKSIVVAPAQEAACFGLLKKGATAPADYYSIPFGDIFGFTSSGDVGDVGFCSVSFEYSARMGKVDGSYFGATLKTQFAATIADGFQVAFSPWISQAKVNNVTGYNNQSTLDFDGFSGELTYQFLARTKTNPVAMSLSIEPRWARLDTQGARLAKAVGVEFKYFADTVVIKDKLHAAVNLNYGLATTRMTDPLATDQQSSYFNMSGALTYQFSPNLFMGVEARHLRAYAGHGLQVFSGKASYFGPTMLYKINDTTNLNFVWTPQISGSPATGSTGLELANFERHPLRVKLVKTF